MKIFPDLMELQLPTDKLWNLMELQLPTDKLWNQNHFRWFAAEFHEEFSNKIRRDFPHTSGDLLALKSLERMDPILAEQARREGVQNFLERKLDEFGGGELPRWRKRDRAQFTRDKSMELDKRMELDYRWIGAALLVATFAAGGAIWLSRRREERKIDEEPDREPPRREQAPARRVKRRAGATLFRKNLTGTLDTSSAKQLFTDARYWWAGDMNDWKSLRSSAELTPEDASSTGTDSELLLAVFEWDGPETVNNRHSGARLLDELSSVGRLNFVGVFVVETTDTSAAGLER